VRRAFSQTKLLFAKDFSVRLDNPLIKTTRPVKESP
jgi:hypothetical protein